jgi:low affinity Fe/Cu permease
MGEKATGRRSTGSAPKLSSASPPVGDNRDSAAGPSAPANLNSAFERFARKVTAGAGHPASFMMALSLVLVWAGTGFLFDYSEMWQLVINTGTTIITFLMVFLIQQAQNKDSQSVQLKLNELIAATTGASSRLINVEDLSEQELMQLHRFYGELVELSKGSGRLLDSHSIEEAEAVHAEKVREGR